VILKGGKAGFKSVTLYSDNYQVKAFKRKNEPIKIIVNELPKKYSKYTDALHDIPFIRGLWLIVDIVFRQWKTTFAIILISIFFTLLTHYLTLEMNKSIDVQLDGFKIIGAFIIIMIFKGTHLGKYHAAEHMIIQSFENNKGLTIEHILKNSRINKGCGTNLVLFLLTVMGIFHLLNINIILTFPLAFSLAYEIFLIKNGLLLYITKPFYWIGSLAQYLFFTSKPAEIHLEVAKTALQKLIELEGHKS
jgi:uncharacterized protein YqhQ